MALWNEGLWAESLWADSVFGIASLAPPTNVTAVVDGSDITITIGTEAASVDGYYYYQSIDDGEWTKLNAVVTANLTYTLTPTEPGEYNFRVTSVLGINESAPSVETLTTETMMEEVYSDTISDLRISAVDGTAFVDAAAAITGYADGNHLLEVTDSAGKVLSGVLKTQGSGETLGSELITNGDMEIGDPPSGWGILNNATLAREADERTGGSGSYSLKGTGGTGSSWTVSYIIPSITTEDNGTLYKCSGWGKATTGTLYNIRFYDGSSSIDIISTVGNTWTFGDGYITKNGNSLRVFSQKQTTATALLDDISCKKVTAPSTSGATLVNEISGTTQNLFDVEDGFDFNKSSYTCTVKQILPT